MVSGIRTEKRRRCPACGAEDLVARLVTENFEHGPDDDRVPVEARDVPVEVCEKCGETFIGPDAARVRYEAICAAHGLLPPNAVRSIRERLGMTQAQFAKLTGISEPSLSRWERGRLLQSTALDRYLRLLANNSENIRTLEKITSDEGGEFSDVDSTATVSNREGRPVEAHVRGQFGMGKSDLLYWYLAAFFSNCYSRSKKRAPDSELADILGPGFFIECKKSTVSPEDAFVQQLAYLLEKQGASLRMTIPAGSRKSSRRFVLDIGPEAITENTIAERTLQFEDVLSEVPDSQRDELVSRLVGIVELLKRRAG